MKAHLARHLANTHGLAIRSGSPRPVMKTRAAFCLITTALTRASRQVRTDSGWREYYICTSLNLRSIIGLSKKRPL